MRLQSNRSSASLSSGKEVVLSPLHSMLGSHWSSLLQLFFIRGRALIQGVHHEHHVWPRWDSGMARPHDLKAQEAECLQEWSYQREGDLLLPGIILFTSPLSHQYQSTWDTPCECIQRFLCREAQLSPAGVLSPALTAAALKCEGILAVQLSSFVHVSPAVLLLWPVRNSNGWLCACTSCISLLSRMHMFLSCPINLER